MNGVLFGTVGINLNMSKNDPRCYVILVTLYLIVLNTALTLRND